jgi:hypothetical protein
MAQADALTPPGEVRTRQGTFPNTGSSGRTHPRIGRDTEGNSSGVDEVLMNLVVMLAGTVDELAGLQDGYERELTNVLESVVAELEKLNADDRRVFATYTRR